MPDVGITLTKESRKTVERLAVMGKKKGKIFKKFFWSVIDHLQYLSQSGAPVCCLVISCADGTYRISDENN